jgi:hypothetical protein
LFGRKKRLRQAHSENKRTILKHGGTSDIIQVGLVSLPLYLPHFRGQKHNSCLSSPWVEHPSSQTPPNKSTKRLPQVGHAASLDMDTEPDLFHGQLADLRVALSGRLEGMIIIPPLHMPGAGGSSCPSRVDSLQVELGMCKDSKSPMSRFRHVDIQCQLGTSHSFDKAQHNYNNTSKSRCLQICRCLVLNHGPNNIFPENMT